MFASDGLSKASRKRRQKVNPVSGGITGQSCSWEGNKYRNLALQVGGVSNEKVKYSRAFCGTSTQELMLWKCPEEIVQVNYRPILSSEWVPDIKKPALVREKTKIWSWAPDGSPTPC
jgi:hypothetical protein